MTNGTKPSLPSTVADLMDHIEQGWSALLGLVETASQEQMNTPGPGGWTLKDILAHITEWKRFLLEYQFRGREAHEALQVDKALLDHPDFDELNAIQVERNRHRPAAEVLADLRQTHAQLCAELAQMSDDDLTRPVDGMFRDAPLVAVVRVITYHHYEEHREMIQVRLNR